MFRGAFLSWHNLEARTEAPVQLIGVMIGSGRPAIAMAIPWCSSVAREDSVMIHCWPWKMFGKNRSTCSSEE